jgi:hypothetical protein
MPFKKDEFFKRGLLHGDEFLIRGKFPEYLNTLKITVVS